MFRFDHLHEVRHVFSQSAILWNTCFQKRILARLQALLPEFRFFDPPSGWGRLVVMPLDQRRHVAVIQAHIKVELAHFARKRGTIPSPSALNTMLYVNEPPLSLDVLAATPAPDFFVFEGMLEANVVHPGQYSDLVN